MSINEGALPSFQERFNDLTSPSQVIDEYRGLLSEVTAEHDARYMAVTEEHRATFIEECTKPGSHDIREVLSTTQINLRSALEPTLKQVDHISSAASVAVTPMLSKHGDLLKRARSFGRNSVGSLVVFTALPGETREAITIAVDNETFRRALEAGKREGIASSGMGSIMTYEASSETATQAMRRATDALVLNGIDAILKEPGGLFSEKLCHLLVNNTRPTLNAAVKCYLDKNVWSKARELRGYAADPSFANTFTALRRSASTSGIGDIIMKDLIKR